MLTDILMH